MTKMMLGAIALAIAVPAYAQTPPAEPKADCCEKKQDGKECCCCKHMDHKGHGEHGGDHQGHDKHAR